MLYAFVCKRNGKYYYLDSISYFSDINLCFPDARYSRSLLVNSLK